MDGGYRDADAMLNGDRAEDAELARETSILAGLKAEDLKSDAEDGMLFSTLKDWAQLAIEHWRPWWENAATEYDFYAGKQWSEEDKAALDAQLRPHITFNRTSPAIDNVVGMEINNREQAQVYPRKIGNVKMSELWTAALASAREVAGSEHEEGDAFLDLVIAGVGWVEGYLTESEHEFDSYDIQDSRVDNCEMAVDPNSKKKNFKDARYLCRIRRVSFNDAKSMFPDADEAMLHAGWACAIDDDVGPGMQPERYLFNEAPSARSQRQTVVIVEIQWWEKAPYWRVVDRGGNVHQLSQKAFDEYKRRLAIVDPGVDAKLTAARYFRKVYKRAFLGKSVLARPAMPCDYSFTYHAMTGKRDKTSRHWFGLMRAMMDPQMWSNKWLSQLLHIINSNAKGGLMASKDVFEDWKSVEKRWSSPDFIAWLNAGKNPDLVKTRDPIRLPEGLQYLMQFATSAVNDVNGISLELLGMADRDQAGVVEYQRRQAGMAILGQFFGALRQMRQSKSRSMLHMIQRWMSDGRLIRVTIDSGDEQYVPLITSKDEASLRYDVVIDEAPSSPNQKEMVWSLLVQAMPLLSSAPLPPQVWVELLKYSPFPSSVISKIAELTTKGPDENAVMQQRLGMALMAAQVKQLEGQAKESEADVVAKMAKAGKDAVDARVAAAQAQAPQEPQQAVAAVQPAAQAVSAEAGKPQQGGGEAMALLDKMMPLLMQATARPQP